MLLLHVCQRVREDGALSAAERAHNAVQTWLEIDDIERRLARHTCELESAFGFQAQEMLFGCVLLALFFAGRPRMLEWEADGVVL